MKLPELNEKELSFLNYTLCDAVEACIERKATISGYAIFYFMEYLNINNPRWLRYDKAFVLNEYFKSGIFMKDWPGRGEPIDKEVNND